MAKTGKMVKTGKMAKRAETTEMAKTAKTAKIGKTARRARRANSNSLLAFLKNKDQGRVSSDFYDFFPERQLNILVYIVSPSSPFKITAGS